jgi:hypothetical protein
MLMTSLGMIGEKDPINGSLSAAEGTYWLGRLNSFMEGLSIDRGAVLSIGSDNFSLTAGTVSYTIGSGGAFNTTRPVKIVNAFVRDSSNFDTQLDIIGQEQYAAIKVKSVGNAYPSALYYDNAYAAGLGTIYVYPAPQAGLTLYINSYKQFASFPSVTTTLVLAPGYQRMIEANFAIDAALGLTSIAPELAKVARESKAAVAMLNLPETIATFDAGVTGRTRGNIITGP